jgi:hypothetical protein
MRINGRQLTSTEIQLCVDDHAMGDEALTKKYNLDKGGEHPVITREVFEAVKKRAGDFDPNRTYQQWVWFRLAMMMTGLNLDT